MRLLFTPNSATSNVVSAYIIKDTFVTIRCSPCGTDSSSMVYQPVAEAVAFLRRYYFPQSHFDFFGIFDLVNKSDSVTKAYAVGVSYDSRLTEYIPHDKVCTFSADTGKAQQVFHIIWNAAVKFVAEHFHTCTYITGFTFA